MIRLKKIWTDPVWSKVISAIIIAAGTVVWTTISSRVNDIDFQTAWLNFWTTKITLWHLTLLLIILLILFWTRQYFKTVIIIVCDLLVVAVFIYIEKINNTEKEKTLIGVDQVKKQLDSAELEVQPLKLSHNDLESLFNGIHNLTKEHNLRRSISIAISQYSNGQDILYQLVPLFTKAGYKVDTGGIYSANRSGTEIYRSSFIEGIDYKYDQSNRRWTIEIDMLRDDRP